MISDGPSRYLYIRRIISDGRSVIDFGSLFAWSKDTELKVSVTSDTVLPGEDGTLHVLLGKSMI